MSIKERNANIFARAICGTRLPNESIAVGKFVLRGRLGVHDSIQYNQWDDVDLLRGEHQYTFSSGNTDIQTSIQLYENDKNYYRVFCYTHVDNISGMTFSINLTTGSDRNRMIALRQRIKFADRHPDKADGGKQHRAEKQRMICAYLIRIGLNLNSSFDVDFGSFDLVKAQFVGTTPERFLNEFLVVSLIKGHYQGNKGYTLPGLPLIDV